MSKHLILPIEIFGTKHCVKHGATTPKWRTVSFLDDSMALTGVENDDKWEIPDTYSNPNGKITFATCCLWKGIVRFLIPSSSEYKSGSVWINEVEIDSFELFTSAGEIVDILIDLDSLGIMQRPCGNIWEISATVEDAGTVGMQIEIIDVEFGPPV
jgi:hypothetical protein